jgi:hypothetical protein
MAAHVEANANSRQRATVDTSTDGDRAPWLFSRAIDLSVFGGSALAAVALLLIGALTGALNADTPDWTWIPAVLLVDVAHVYSTGLRIYLDRAELRRRPLLYTLVPVVGLVAAFTLVGLGEHLFWRVLAYLAVFHFVRQQYGWVALYRRKAGDFDRLGRWIDTAAIYAATLYPLAYWHANLPRHYWWFLEGDFAIGLPIAVVEVLEPVYWILLALYAARAIWNRLAGKRPNPGKDLVVATTAFCWYVGIVGLNSDYAFTVTNVVIHGVPYVALVYLSGRRSAARPAASSTIRAFRFGLVPFLLTLWAFAYVEELLWHRLVWWDREWLFGGFVDPGQFKPFVIALLALPQIVHYVLDGFIWRRGQARYL